MRGVAAGNGAAARSHGSHPCLHRRGRWARLGQRRERARPPLRLPPLLRKRPGQIPSLQDPPLRRAWSLSKRSSVRSSGMPTRAGPDAQGMRPRPPQSLTWARVARSDTRCVKGAVANARGCLQLVGACAAASRTARSELSPPRRHRVRWVSAAASPRATPRMNSQPLSPSPKKSLQFVQAVKRAQHRHASPVQARAPNARAPAPPHGLTGPCIAPQQAPAAAATPACRGQWARLGRHQKRREQGAAAPRCASASSPGQTPRDQDPPLRKARSLSKQSSAPQQRHAILALARTPQHAARVGPARRRVSPGPGTCVVPNGARCCGRAAASACSASTPACRGPWARLGRRRQREQGAAALRCSSDDRCPGAPAAGQAPHA